MPRLVHLADLHLGFRQYDRIAADGTNQREADIGATFARVVGQVIELAPDLVVVAGDVFHVVRPSNASITQAFQQMQRLREALPDMPIVLVAGNHEQPKTHGTTCILELFRRIPHVHVASHVPKLVRLGDVSVLAVPEMHKMPPLETDDAAYRVLLLHGEVEGCMRAAARNPEKEIPLDALGLDRWTYIALGHYHVMREVAPQACYAGSMDYTSSDPWGEMREQAAAGLPGKGFLEVDLASGARTFHHVAPARPLIDLPAFSAAGLTAAEVDAKISDTLDAVGGDMDGAILRLVIEDLPLSVRREIDTKKHLDRAKSAFIFRIDDRRPPKALRLGGALSVPRQPSPQEMLVERIRERAEDLGISVDECAEDVLQLLEDSGEIFLGPDDEPLDSWHGGGPEPCNGDLFDTLPQEPIADVA